jgi:hypothetical protein
LAAVQPIRILPNLKKSGWIAVAEEVSDCHPDFDNLFPNFAVVLEKPDQSGENKRAGALAPLIP